MMSASYTPLPGKEFVRTVADRRATGRALRKEVPRSSHAEWSPVADRPDPISLLEDQNLFRQAQLVPIRYGRMAASPFGFLRGAAVVMAQDLAATPVTGLEVQVCGDAHLSNFGVYATPERDQVFDVNDFDETLPGPWEWDIKRLAASVVVAGRTNGFSGDTNRQAVLRCVREYRERVWEARARAVISPCCRETGAATRSSSRSRRPRLQSSNVTSAPAPIPTMVKGSSAGSASCRPPVISSLGGRKRIPSTFICANCET